MLARTQRPLQFGPVKWKSIIAELQTYVPEAKSASTRVHLRWDTVSLVSDRQSVFRTNKVHLVTVCRHRGIDLNIEDGLADITLRHMQMRHAAAVGDFVVGRGSPSGVTVEDLSKAHYLSSSGH